MSVAVHRDDGVARIECADVDHCNGMSESFIGGLLEALAAVQADPQVRVVVLAGTPRWFCSGATVQTVRDVQSQRISPAELTLGRRLIGLPIPTIAAVEGDTLGGGLALMLSADLVVLASESRHAANFMTLGITPGMGIIELLTARVGAALAHEMLYTGRSIRGDAFPAGAFNAVVPRAHVRSHAEDLAWEIAGKDRDNLRLLKRALSLPRRRALEEAMTLESLMHESSLWRWDERQMQ